ncbi:DUF4373 domain-containing protein [Dorea sp. AF24-7LB]|uniref:DUF4373 domain-containing protein n=1 Tax=Dorea sp. AF24-7LB TaxID=2293097 RepID=UPI000E4D81E8|nr:DUF4373 domain-containing protein [Dorea sp. AF24-7LB]RHQ56469.1 DUF4373 domain-containing protein [Dorea sp. AF24-7LB]
MARPRLKGLLYFPFDIDFFEDNKIRILKARYKSDGVLIYLFLLCEIYRQGYYIKVDDDFEYIISDELGIDQNKVKQVLNFLLKRSLFDNTLFSLDKVLTSAGIQRRYQLGIKERMRKSRTPLEVGRYWLLNEEDTEPFIKCTLFEENSGKYKGFSGKNSLNSEKNDTKKSKVNNKNNNIAFQHPELEQAFQMYLLVREHNYGEILPEQIQALRDDLKTLSDKAEEQIAIVKKATAGGYKGFYELKTGKRKPGSRQKNKANNFSGRDYNMEKLERGLLGVPEKEGDAK